MIDRRVFSHFGRNPANYGYGADDILSRMAPRSDVEVLIVTAALVEWLERPRYAAYTPGDLEPLVLNRDGRAEIAYDHVRLMAKRLIADRRAHLSADVITVSALTICGMMTPGAWMVAAGVAP
jgi:hypothetical protein